ncbi:hypothetical protein HK098_000526, partial [Nowakowskiella sp. JEL0407]
MAGRLEWSEDKKITQIVWYIKKGHYRDKVLQIKSYKTPKDKKEDEKPVCYKEFWTSLEAALENCTGTIQDLYNIVYEKNKVGEKYIERVRKVMANIPSNILPEAMKMHHLKKIMPAFAKSRVAEKID